MKFYKEIHDQLLSRLETSPIFPKIYDGFREIDSLVESEDELLAILKACAEKASKDKLLTNTDGSYTNIVSNEKLTEWETELGVSSSSDATLTQRQQAVCNYISRSRVINDDYLQSFVTEVSGSDLLVVHTDCDNLVCSISTPPNTEDVDQTEAIQTAVESVMPIVPQNLTVKGSFSADISKNLVSNYAYEASLKVDLGLVEWNPPPEPTGMIVGGTLAVTSEGETTLLRENWIGSLSRNITLESATVTTGTIDVQKSGTVYARSGSYQTLNGTLNAGATSVVYDSESNVSKEGETGAYVITSVYNNGGSAVAYDDLQLLVRSSDNKLVLVNNGETAISWCRLNYKIDPIATFELFIDD